jgi:hypothetical protein
MLVIVCICISYCYCSKFTKYDVQYHVCSSYKHSLKLSFDVDTVRSVIRRGQRYSRLPTTRWQRGVDRWHHDSGTHQDCRPA